MRYLLSIIMLQLVVSQTAAADLPGGTEYFSFGVSQGRTLRSLRLFAKPELIKRALCDNGRFYEIRFDKRIGFSDHQPNGTPVFEEEVGDYFRFVKDDAKPDNCLIGNDQFFKDREILPLTDNRFLQEWFDKSDRPPCDAVTVDRLKETKGIGVKRCWQLARLPDSGAVAVAEFETAPNGRLAAFSLIGTDRVVFQDLPGRQTGTPGDDVWGLGDGGEFPFDRYFVLLAMKVQGEVELFTLVFGGEGVNYVLLRTDGSNFHERAHEYVYAMGH